MNWRVEFRPEVEQDMAEAAAWYERRHPTKNVPWRYPERFPCRLVCEVSETGQTVVLAAVLHPARDDRHWQRRI